MTLHNTATTLVSIGKPSQDSCHTVNPPVYRASTILQPTLEQWHTSKTEDYTGFTYGRKKTPTSECLESAVASMYGVSGCVAVCSGVAAITVAILSLVKPGDHLLIPDSVFGPARHLCDSVLHDLMIDVDYYPPSIGSDIENFTTDKTSLIYMESPGSLTFEVQDIDAIVKVARKRNIKTVIDNTWATSLLFNPFQYGADVVIEAATKYLGGHSDLLMGLILSDKDIGDLILKKSKIMGMCVSSDDCYLALRGIRTLALRLQKSGENALALAKWLAEQPEVISVNHPGLAGSSSHALWKKYFNGASGLFSIALSKNTNVSAFFNSLTLFGIGASWGGYESLVMPINLEGLRNIEQSNHSGSLVRIYTGIEDISDLTTDIANALKVANS